MSEIFMCYMEGRTRPKRKHPTLEIAMAEAKRLSELPDCPGRVFVLADVAVVEKPKPPEPIVTVKKRRLTLPPDGVL